MNYRLKIGVLKLNVVAVRETGATSNSVFASASLHYPFVGFAAVGFTWRAGQLSFHKAAKWT